MAKDKPIIGYDSNGQPSIIRYDVPLPGAHKGRRLVQLDIDLPDKHWVDLDTPEKSLRERLQMQQKGERWVYDKVAAHRYFVDAVQALSLPTFLLTIASTDSSSVSSAVIADVRSATMHTGEVAKLNEAAVVDATAAPQKKSSTAPVAMQAELVVAPVNSDAMRMITLHAKARSVAEGYAQFLQALSRGMVLKPTLSYTGKLVLMPGPADDKVARPSFFIVETYEISSFMGDYGLGATKKTFTLLPGEEMKISLKTWKTSRRSFEQGSSIIDSYTETAAEKFASSMQSETTDKTTKSKTEEWQAEAEASASWGWGKAKVSGGGGGEYSSGRESFAKQLAETTSEHSSEASANRETTVTSSSESEEEEGQERTEERTIRNVNMRRPLTFVFRELNQEYLTYFTLRDIRIGYFSGKAGAWREVPLYEFRTLVEETVKGASEQKKVLRQIINAARFTRTPSGEVVESVMRVDTGTNGSIYDPQLIPRGDEVRADSPGGGAALVEPPADRSWHYAFLSGSNGYGEDYKHKPEGILTGFRSLVMRTESLVVEALLGQSDALDNFAMEVQVADASRRTLENDKLKLGLDIVGALPDGPAKAEAYAKVFATQAAE